MGFFSIFPNDIPKTRIIYIYINIHSVISLFIASADSSLYVNVLMCINSRSILWWSDTETKHKQGSGHTFCLLSFLLMSPLMLLFSVILVSLSVWESVCVFWNECVRVCVHMPVCAHACVRVCVSVCEAEVLSLAVRADGWCGSMAVIPSRLKEH